MAGGFDVLQGALAVPADQDGVRPRFAHRRQDLDPGCGQRLGQAGAAQHHDRPLAAAPQRVHRAAGRGEHRRVVERETDLPQDVRVGAAGSDGAIGEHHEGDPVTV